MMFDGKENAKADVYISFTKYRSLKRVNLGVIMLKLVRMHNMGIFTVSWSMGVH